jgi:hypothetical protein
MQRFKQLALDVALLAGVGGQAVAATQKWVFQDVTFGDGGTLTGSFVLDDAVPNWITAVDITTSFTSDVFAGATYSEANLITVGGSLSQFSFTSGDGQYVLAFTPAEDLGFNFPSGLGVVTFPYGTTVDLDLDNFQNYEARFAPAALRQYVTGSIVAVPEPSAVAMFGIGLSALAFAGLRRRSNARRQHRPKDASH